MTIAWITGGGTGIGRALAEALCAEGAAVVISGRRKDILDKTAQEIAATCGAGAVMAMAGDASDPGHAAEVAAKTADRWGPINLLINNAGSNLNRPLLETSPDDYRTSFEMNCLTAIQATRAVLPGMLKAKDGAIVNISSIYGKWASSRSASYSVGKYAMAGFTDALRQELAGAPIHVLGVYPGFIRTDMTMPFVKPGSLRSWLGKSADQMARAILKAVERGKTELYFPWYVPWALRLHRWMPGMANWFARRVKGEFSDQNSAPFVH